MKKQEILDAFYFRHACKEFDADKTISDDDFSFILETARLSPSSFGFEPWHFLIIQDASIRETFLPLFWGAQKQFPTASHVVFTLVKKPFFMAHDAEYIQQFMKEVQQLPDDILEMKAGFYKNFQESDFDLTESERSMTDWAAHQTYIPLANMMTAAAMVGIDSCPIEGFQRDKVDKLLASELNIDLEHFTLGHACAFGYRKQEPRTKTRQDLETITTWF